MNVPDEIALAGVIVSGLVAVATLVLAWTTRTMSMATRDMADGTTKTLEQGRKQLQESQRQVAEARRHADAAERHAEVAERQARRSLMPHLVLSNYDKIFADNSQSELVFSLNNIGPGTAFGLGGVLFLGFNVGDGALFFEMHEVRYESEHSAAILPDRSEQLRVRVPTQLRNYLSGGSWNGFHLELNYFDTFGARYMGRIMVMARQVHNQVFEDQPDDWMRPARYSADRRVFVLNGKVENVGEEAREWFNTLPT